MTKLKSKPISLRLDEKLHADLTEHAQKEGKTLATLLREIIYTENQFKTHKGLRDYQQIDYRITAMRSGIHASAENIDMSFQVIKNQSQEIGTRLEELNKALKSLEGSGLGKLQTMKTTAISLFLATSFLSLVLIGLAIKSIAF